MPQTLNYWILQSIAMGLTVALIPKLRVTSIFGPIGAVIALALVNAFVWDAALFFSVPNSLSTQVLLLFLVNGGIFWLIVKMLPGIEVDGVVPALVAPIVFTICSVLISTYAKDVDWEKLYKSALVEVGKAKEFFTEQLAENNTALEEKPK